MQTWIGKTFIASAISLAFSAPVSAVSIGN